MVLKQKSLELVKPILIVVSLLIALIAMIETGWVKIESLWFVFPFSGIRVSTLLTAIACFALVLFLQRKNTLKSVYYASLAVIFSMGLFEILWYYSAAAYRGWDLRIFEFAALSGWVLLGIREVFRKRPPKVSIMLYGVFVVSMIIWLAIGFPFNDLGNSSFSVSAEILNELSKTSLFIAYALHVGSIKGNTKP
jgi:hypothetical protein